MAFRLPLPRSSLIMGALATLFILTGSFTIILAGENESLNAKLNNVTQEYVGYRQESQKRLDDYALNVTLLQKENADLASELSDAQSRYATLNSTYQALGQKYQLLQSGVESTLDKIDTYETELRDSILWFKENSKLGLSFKEEAAKTYLKDNCFQKSTSSCKLLTGCLNLVNAEYLGLEYKYDNTTSQQSDKLQSLFEFGANKGGDCEDYSLFYKAEWNYLLEACGDSPIEVQAWYTDASILPDQAGQHKHWLNYPKTWYLEGVREKSFEGFKHPNIACGLLYDPNQGKAGGHCVIALTRQEILSINDLPLLDGAVLIEPQTGEFIGLVNDPSTNIRLLFPDNENQLGPYLSQIITDTDRYLYSQTYHEWEGYASFSAVLEEQKTRLLDMRQ